MSGAVRLTTAFAVPWLESDVVGPEGWLSELRAFLLSNAESLRLRWSPEAAPITFDGLVFTRPDLLSLPDAPIRALDRLFRQAVLRAVESLSGRPSGMDPRSLTFESWASIGKSGAALGVHNHPMASLSGVLCVDPGEEAPGWPESGILRFYPPAFAAPPFPGEMRSPWSARSFDVAHRAGHLVMFPSFLHHEALPYKGERERIVVAFNCRFAQST